MNSRKFIIGIDLGTTHCVVSYCQPESDDAQERAVQIFPVEQLISPHEVMPRDLLPSFVLLPGEHDVPENGLALPWRAHRLQAVGEFARRRGADLPQRLVHSAKSWLCHSGVDRTANILPFEAPQDAKRISPVQASSMMLEHIKEAWNHRMSHPLEEQALYLTVPASFDTVARELTIQAAQQAGLQNIVLLEEPQAAFYAWLDSIGDAWRKQVSVGETILVCDIGGGTTDLSLIQVVDEDGDLGLRRIAVGSHILLGGDNMDLSLAYAAQTSLSPTKALDSWQLRGLLQSCRQAKERLLSGQSQSEALSVVGRGKSLIAATLRTDLSFQQVQSVVLDGFFPECEFSSKPQRGLQMGMREMGLPFEPDPAITRHVAWFLSRHVVESHSQPPIEFPSAVLFNGGVLKAPLIQERLLQVLSAWRGQKVRRLEYTDLDLAVSRGASVYGLASCGRAIRIRAGTERTYYIGIESAMPAVPGFQTPKKALCVAPFGLEEGTQLALKQKEFGLLTGQPAQFELLASTIRTHDAAGDVVEDADQEIEAVVTMQVHLQTPDSQEQEQHRIPVWLESRFTELGTLELWCVSDADNRWKLEFNLRDQEQAEAT